MIDRDASATCGPEQYVDAAKRRILISELLLGFAALVGVTLWFSLHRLGFYTLADTLLDYEQGFYRRALLGNLFLVLPAWFSVSAAMKVLFVGSLSAIFVLAAQLVPTAGAWRARLLLGAVIAVFPFGLTFYLKDMEGVRKELVFFPLLVLFAFARSGGRARANLAAIGVTLVGCLIHESYVFLVLPFLLSILWLDGRLTRWWLGAHLVFIVGLNAAIMACSVGPEAPVNDAAQTVMALGYPSVEAADFVRYNLLTPAENITKSIRHLSGPSLYLFLVVLLIQEVLLLTFPRMMGWQFTYRQPRRLLVCLAGLALGTALLICVAMDYGRWLTFSFILGCFLAASQVERVIVRPEQRRPAAIAVALVAVCVLLLVARVPHYTTRLFRVQDWTMIPAWQALLGG